MIQWWQNTFPFAWADLSQLSGVLVALAIGMLGYLAVALRALLGPSTPTLRLLGGAALACFFALAGYGYELSNVLLSGTLLGFELKMTATYMAGALFFLYVMTYTGARDAMSRMVQGGVVLVPLVLIALIWTNDAHNLYQFDTHLDCRVSFCPLSRGGFGGAYSAGTAYLSALGIYALGRLAVFYPRVSRVYQKQIMLLFGLFLIPLTASVLASSGSSLPALFRNQDVPTLSLIPGALLMVWGGTRLQLTRLTPEVWGRAVDRRDEMTLALDRERRVVEASPTAQTLLGSGLLGRTLEQVFPGGVPNHSGELQLGARHFEVQLTALGRPAAPSGHLLRLQEVTQLKASELLARERLHTLAGQQAILERLHFEETVAGRFSAQVMGAQNPQEVMLALENALEQLFPAAWGAALTLEQVGLSLKAGLDIERKQGDEQGQAQGQIFECWGGGSRLATLHYQVPHASSALGVVLERLQLGLYTLHLQDTLRQSALRDKLTGLLNRRALDQQLEGLERDEGSASLVLFDVDRFRDFNARHGYAGGDQVLRAIGTHLLERCCDTPYLPFRYGGEEFCVLLPELPLEQAQVWTEALCADLGKLAVTLEGRTLNVTVSASLAHTALGHAGLLTAADAALHRAKRNGRNRIEQATQTSSTWGSGWG